MSVATYALHPHDQLLSPVNPFTRWFHDLADDTDEYQLADAQVASGDYFATLATELDKLAQVLPSNSGEQIVVEEMVDTLLYLDKHYKIVRRSR